MSEPFTLSVTRLSTGLRRAEDVQPWIQVMLPSVKGMTQNSPSATPTPRPDPETSGMKSEVARTNTDWMFELMPVQLKATEASRSVQVSPV